MYVYILALENKMDGRFLRVKVLRKFPSPAVFLRNKTIQIIVRKNTADISINLLQITTATLWFLAAGLQVTVNTETLSEISQIYGSDG